MVRIPRIVKLCGTFKDQQGIAARRKIVGYTSSQPIRQYVWVKPKLRRLRGKKFEAADDQITYNMRRCK